MVVIRLLKKKSWREQRTSTNTLFEPYRRNSRCEPSKPLGTWTTKKKTEPVEEEDDEE